MAERPAKQPRLEQDPAILERETAQRQRVGRPEGWSQKLAAGAAGAAGHRYVPVGALVCAPRLVQPIRKALEGVDWMKKTPQRIHAYCGGGGELLGEPQRGKQMAIHVCPVGAATLDAAVGRATAARAGGQPPASGVAAPAAGEEDVNPWAAELPSELAVCAKLLHSGEARWHSGLRVGDRVEDGGLGAQWHLIPADVKQQQERHAAANASTQQQGGGAAASRRTFRFIELFAGIGGFRVAFESIGGECIFSSEIGVEERLTYAKTVVLSHLYSLNRTFYQDRLGTNIVRESTQEAETVFLGTS